MRSAIPALEVVLVSPGPPISARFNMIASMVRSERGAKTLSDHGAWLVYRVESHHSIAGVVIGAGQAKPFGYREPVGLHCSK